jgi:hypothetical protein
VNTACIQNTQLFDVSANSTVRTIANEPQGDSIGMSPAKCESALVQPKQ